VTLRFGPLHVDVDTRRLATIWTGVRVAVRRRGEPIDPERVPEGWELRHRNHPRGPWPTGWLDPTGYWVSIWRRGDRGAHIRIKPDGTGWRVHYDPENSWMGGDLLGPKFPTYERAVDVALDAARRLSAGDGRQDVRYDYDALDDGSESDGGDP